jgi:hypothetical protein
MDPIRLPWKAWMKGRQPQSSWRFRWTPICYSWMIGRGVIVARERGLRVTGTLGVLDIAADRGLVNFAQVVNRLRQTSFRIPQALLDSLMKKHAQQVSNT